MGLDSVGALQASRGGVARPINQVSVSLRSTRDNCTGGGRLLTGGGLLPWMVALEG